MHHIQQVSQPDTLTTHIYHIHTHRHSYTDRQIHRHTHNKFNHEHTFKQTYRDSNTQTDVDELTYRCCSWCRQPESRQTPLVSLSLSLSLSLPLSLCLCICLSLCLSVCLSLSLYDGCSKDTFKQLNSIHRRAVKHLISKQGQQTDEKLKLLKILPLEKQLEFNKTLIVHKIYHERTPSHLNHLLQKPLDKYNSKKLILPLPRIDLFKNSLAFS